MTVVPAAKACRWCGATAMSTVADLGEQPLANDLRATASASLEQPRYPLVARVCESCLLVQADVVVPPEVLFGDYPYQSGYSSTWRAHVAAFAAWLRSSGAAGPEPRVLELASNDGSLLAAVVAADERAVVLGVEPASAAAAAARAASVPTVEHFFGREHAAELAAQFAPTLVVANNVWAHVPDLRDFTEGLAVLAGAGALVSIEVPHLLRLFDRVAFDTIYHEHHSYFSLLAASRVLTDAGLALVDVHEIDTHGGSLRLLARAAGSEPDDDARRRIDGVVARERAAGLDGAAPYDRFAADVRRCREDLRAFLDDAATRGEVVAGYAAAAKATVLLNAVDARERDVAAVGDLSPHKVGRFVPGTGIPIVTPGALLDAEPRHILVFAWNLIDEIDQQLAARHAWGGELVTAVPALAVR